MHAHSYGVTVTLAGPGATVNLLGAAGSLRLHSILPGQPAAASGSPDAWAVPLPLPHFDASGSGSGSGGGAGGTLLFVGDGATVTCADAAHASETCALAVPVACSGGSRLLPNGHALLLGAPSNIADCHTAGPRNDLGARSVLVLGEYYHADTHQHPQQPQQPHTVSNLRPALLLLHPGGTHAVAATEAAVAIEAATVVTAPHTLGAAAELRELRVSADLAFTSPAADVAVAALRWTDGAITGAFHTARGVTPVAVGRGGLVVVAARRTANDRRAGPRGIADLLAMAPRHLGTVRLNVTAASRDRNVLSGSSIALGADAVVSVARAASLRVLGGFSIEDPPLPRTARTGVAGNLFA
jgi:hypothetical protein